MRAIGLVIFLALGQDPIPSDSVPDWKYAVEETNEQGQREVVARIEGSEARPLTSRLVEIKNPRAVYYTRPADAYDESRTLHLEAEGGTYDSQTQILKLTGNAIVRSDDGSRMELEDLTHDFPQRTFHTDKSFSLVRPGVYLRAVGLEADDSLRRLIARRNAYLTLSGPPESILEGAPSDDQATSRLRSAGTMTILEMPREQRILIEAHDRVRLSREHPDGPTVATSDHMELTLLQKRKPKDRVQILEAFAWGNVAVRQGDSIRVLGDRANWKREGDILFLTGTRVTLERRGDGSEAPLRATGTSFQWKRTEKQGLLTGNSTVRLEQNGLTIEATRLGLVGRSLLLLMGRKVIHIRRENLDISATCEGDATVDTTTGELTMLDRCRLRTPEFTMLCDRLRVREEGSILEAGGNVHISRTATDMTIHGSALRYDPERRFLRIAGRPHVIAETEAACHYWGPTTIDEATEHIEARPGARPMYSIIFREKK